MQFAVLRSLMVLDGFVEIINGKLDNVLTDLEA